MIYLKSMDFRNRPKNGNFEHQPTHMKPTIPMYFFRIIKALFILGTIGFAQTPFTSAQLIQNGDFEISKDSNFQLFFNIEPGDNFIESWTVDSGDIDLVKGHWNAYDGQHSVDLNGYSEGSLSQSFTTLVGGIYKVHFRLSGNPYGVFPVKRLNVSVSSISRQFEFNTTNHTGQDMGWELHRFMFRAVDTLTTLKFSSLLGSNAGPVIDDVQVIDLFSTDTIKDNIVYFPSAFSPNGDDLNDEFKFVTITNSVFSVREFTLYNSWGEHIYSQKQFDVDAKTKWWDGTVNQEDVQPGSYLYIVEIEFTNGKVKRFTGTVLLVR